MSKIILEKKKGNHELVIKCENADVKIILDNETIGRVNMCYVVENKNIILKESIRVLYRRLLDMVANQEKDYIKMYYLVESSINDLIDRSSK